MRSFDERICKVLISIQPDNMDRRIPMMSLFSDFDLSLWDSWANDYLDSISEINRQRYNEQCMAYHAANRGIIHLRCLPKVSSLELVQGSSSTRERHCLIRTNLRILDVSAVIYSRSTSAFRKIPSIATITLIERITERAKLTTSTSDEVLLRDPYREGST